MDKICSPARDGDIFPSSEKQNSSAFEKSNKHRHGWSVRFRKSSALIIQQFDLTDSPGKRDLPSVAERIKFSHQRTPCIDTHSHQEPKRLNVKKFLLRNANHASEFSKKSNQNF